MDSSHVIWEAATAMEEVVDYERIRAAAPHLVVIAFGLNDIGLIHMTPEDFAAGACRIVQPSSTGKAAFILNFGTAARRRIRRCGWPDKH